MKVRMLSSCPDDPTGPQFLSSYLVNDSLIVDAGAAGFCADLPEFDECHVLVSHSHMDHVASLPMLIDRVCSRGQGPVTIHASAETLRSLREDIFNDRVWVDLERVQAGDKHFVEFHVLRLDRDTQILGMSITPIAVDHVVPTVGFVIDDGDSAVVFGADSCATSRIWEVASENPRLSGAFLECSYPSHMTEMAEITHHLTASQMIDESLKLPAGVKVVAVHLKSEFRDEIASEIESLSDGNIAIGVGGSEYQF